MGGWIRGGCTVTRESLGGYLIYEYFVPPLLCGSHTFLSLWVLQAREKSCLLLNTVCSGIYDASMVVTGEFESRRSFGR